MKKILSLFLILFGLNQIGLSQTITTISYPSVVCEASSYVVSYTTSGFSIAPTNVFVVQLSDDPSFSTSETIGTLSSTAPTGSIPINIPATLTTTSTNAYIRVSALAASSYTYNGTNVTVSKLSPTASINTGPSTICEGDFLPVSSTVNTYTSVLWTSSGSGNFSSASSLSSNYTPSPGSVGIEYLTFTAYNTACTVPVTDVLTLTINPNPVASFSASDDFICPSQVVAFTNLSTISSGSIVNYKWTFYDDNSISTIQNPTHVSTFVAGGFGVDLLVFSDKGCFNSYNGASINVLSLPVASFSTPATFCSSQPITFTNNSTVSGAQTITSSAWDFGNSNTSSLTSPVFSYTNSGAYTVSLTVSTNENCVGTYTSPIVVNSTPSTGFITPSSICPMVSANFTDTSIVSGGASITAYNWKFGDGNTSTLPNPAHAYSVAGTYVVTLTTLANNGCSNKKATSITVNPKPIAGFSSATTACPTDIITFTNASTITTGTISNYLWNFADSYTSTTTNTTHGYSASGTYVVSLTATSGIGCTSTTMQTITVNPAISLTVTANGGSTVCEGNSLILSAISNNATSYTWLTTGETTANIQTPLLTASSYYVVEAQNALCSKKDTFFITVNPKPVLTFTINNTSCGNANGGVISSVSAGTAPYAYSWSNGETGVSITNLTANTYALSVTDANGCVQTNSVNVGNSNGPSIANINNINASCSSSCDGSISVTASGGLTPYTFNWGSLTTNNTASVSSLCAGNYSFSIKDANNCIVNGLTSIIATGVNPTFYGNISLSSVGINSGNVKLLKNSNNSLAMETEATTNVDASGNYSFPSVSVGTYLLVAEANSTNYPLAAKTYYNGANSWVSAISINAQCNTTYEKDISLIPLTSLTGNDIISGTIYNLNAGKTNTIGDPIPGVDVSLEQNPGGIMVAQTQTDINGKYNFLNISSGNYTLFVDMPGIGMTSSHNIAAIGSGSSYTDNNFYVDSALTIYSTEPVVTLTSTKENKTEFATKTYPNPFNSQLTVAITSNQNTSVTIALYSVLGEKITVIETKLNTNKNYISLTNLENIKAGVYILKVKTPFLEDIIRVVKAE